MAHTQTERPKAATLSEQEIREMKPFHIEYWGGPKHGTRDLRHVPEEELPPEMRRSKNGPPFATFKERVEVGGNLIGVYRIACALRRKIDLTYTSLE